MKVLILNHETKLGGGETMLLRFLRQCDKNNFEAYLILPGDGALKLEAERIGVKVEVVPFEGELLTMRRKSSMLTLSRAVSLMKNVRTLREKIHSLKPDVIFSNSMKAHIYGSLAIRNTGIPYGWRLHDIVDSNGFSTLQRNLILWFARRYPQNIAAVSEAAALPLYGAKVDRRKISVIHNGIETDGTADETAGKEFRSSVGFSDEHFVVTLPGRIMPQKGHAVFIEAARIVIELIPHVRFIFVGEPFYSEYDYKADLEALIRTYSLGQYFVFAGFQQNMAAVYAASDVVVQPSILPDSFPTVLLEAMAASCIVIASDAGGSKEIITDGVDGFIVPAGDVMRLAGIIREVVSNISSLKELRTRARQKILDRFSSVHYIRKMESWITNLHNRNDE